MGLQQAEVGRALRRIYGNELSQATVCRFEAMKKQPSKHEQAEKNPGGLAERGLRQDHPKTLPLNPVRMEVTRKTLIQPKTVIQVNPRKRRTPVTGPIRKFLESEFRKQSSFNSEEIKRVADTVKLEASVVKVWFHNRRQREKRNIQGSVFQHSASSSN